MNCRIAFTRFGVSAGFACSISAIVPLTTGEAMLVPLSDRYGSFAVGTVPHSRISGLVLKSVLPASASDSMPTPGATRSGLAWKSIAVGPRELNAGDGVVAAIDRAVVARRADGDDPRRVAGRADRAVLRLAVGRSAEVARGGDDDEPGLDRALGGERQRVGVVRLVDAGGDREVDDAEVQRVLVRDRVVDRRDDVADVALAGGVEHFLDEQRRARRDAAAAAARVVAVAGDDARRRACRGRSRRRRRTGS